ncbi:LysR family transcriptional regulator [Rhodanobacter aciditrophus]|uniref:LysR family transcriptional regulator n=1 Tax=Rhodanobacter aciditrophus TaxID=1623218 RepID=A0ABW4B234_9GAMM
MQNLEHLRMLVLSADLGSFSACARHMGKVQSAVSHGISNLEIDLNVELFDRSTRKPSLTPAGERLYRSAKALLTQSEEFELIAKAINRQEEGTLRLAVDDGLMTPTVLQVLGEFSQKFTHTQLDLVLLPSPDIIRQVQQGHCVLGLMTSEVESFKEVAFSYIGQMEMVPVCHPEHELATHSGVTETDLFPHRQITVRGHQKVEPASLVSMSPNNWWSSSHSAAQTLIEQNIGWGYLPKHKIESELKQKRLIAIQTVFDQRTWEVPVDLVWPKGATIGPALHWLLNAFKDAF